MRRILATSSIGNQPHNLHGKYIPGAGVGATSVSTRRLKLFKSCDPQPIMVYLRISDIATYDQYADQWILNKNTLITSLQYLTINSGEYLFIPYDMTFTNNGFFDNYGTVRLDNDENLYPNNNNVGAMFYNTGKFNNYRTLEIADYCGFYTYGGGQFYNSTVTSYPVASTVVSNDATFAIAPMDDSTCGTGTFTGKDVVGTMIYACPP